MIHKILLFMRVVIHLPHYHIKSISIELKELMIMEDMYIHVVIVMIRCLKLYEI